MIDFRIILLSHLLASIVSVFQHLINLFPLLFCSLQLHQETIVILFCGFQAFYFILQRINDLLEVICLRFQLIGLIRLIDIVKASQVLVIVRIHILVLVLLIW